MRDRAYALLDEQVFPRLVAYISSREHIMAVLVMMLALMYPMDPVMLVLIANTYLNGMGLSTGSIITRQQTEHHEDVIDRHEDHADNFDRLLEDMAAIKRHLGMAEA